MTVMQDIETYSAVYVEDKFVKVRSNHKHKKAGLLTGWYYRDNIWIKSGEIAPIRIEENGLYLTKNGSVIKASRPLYSTDYVGPIKVVFSVAQAERGTGTCHMPRYGNIVFYDSKLRHLSDSLQVPSDALDIIGKFTGKLDKDVLIVTDVCKGDKMKTEERISWHNYFLEIMETVAKRSTCLRRQIGALAVKDKRILCTGYNGSPPGTKHCLDIGCIREKKGIPSGEQAQLCRAIHAEQNLIVQAALHGIKIEGCDIYCKTQPCGTCLKMLLGIMPKRIIYLEPYPDELSNNFLNETGIQSVFRNDDLVVWEFSTR